MLSHKPERGISHTREGYREKQGNKRKFGRREELRDGERRQRLGATVYVNFVPTVHYRGNKRKQLHCRQVQFVPRYYKKGGTRRRKKRIKKKRKWERSENERI